MKVLEYILDGFGFESFSDFFMSSFGFILNIKIIGFSVILSVITTIIYSLFGVSLPFLIAYFVLILFEWITGILASKKRGERHDSRKLGRMIFKISIYSVPLYIFNTFQKEVNFPKIMNYEIDPFVWLYWTVVIVVIWQLFVSLLENLEHLNVRYATVLLKIINKKFYKKFDIQK